MVRAEVISMPREQPAACISRLVAQSQLCAWMRRARSPASGTGLLVYMGMGTCHFPARRPLQYFAHDDEGPANIYMLLQSSQVANSWPCWRASSRSALCIVIPTGTAPRLCDIRTLPLQLCFDQGYGA